MIASRTELDQMKAWRVGHDMEAWCMLIFAPTRNRARHLGREQWPASDEPDYHEIYARREPDFDGTVTVELVAVCQEDLPEGTAEFWCDDEDWGELP